MKALIWKSKSEKTVELSEKPFPKIIDPKDAIVKVTLSSICTSDLHIKNGFVPASHEGVTLGHEFVGEVVEIGNEVTNLKIGDRVSANCETFCGECYFCKRGFINNCEKGGWLLGCSIDGCQAEYIRVPYADNGLTGIPDNLSYKNALFAGDILASGYFGAELCEVTSGDTVAVIGSGPVGLCSMICARILGAEKVIAIDTDPVRLNLAQERNLADYTINPLNCNIEEAIKSITSNRGADKVIEAAGGKNTFETAWKIARPNGIIAVVAMYEENQILPLPQMYGKNLIFKTGGVDGIHSEKLLNLISEGKINTDFLITHTYPLERIEEGYKLFETRPEPCLKIAIES